MDVTVVDNLIDARDRIVDPACWTIGTRARDAVGAAIDYHNPNAVSWCAEGSLWLTLKNNQILPLHRFSLQRFSKPEFQCFLEKAAFNLSDTEGRECGWVIAYINDCCGHEAVLKMYDHAIELAKTADDVF